MAGKGVQELFLGGEVLHELRRQFHKIPIDVCAAQAFVSGVGEYFVQAVPELVQESFHFIESQQGGSVLRGLGEVHYDRYVRAAVLAACFVYPLPFVARHPRPRTFSGSGMEVGIEHGKICAVLVEYFVGFHIFVIDGNICVFLEGDAV